MYLICLMSCYVALTALTTVITTRTECALSFDITSASTRKHRPFYYDKKNINQREMVFLNVSTNVDDGKVQTAVSTSVTPTIDVKKEGVKIFGRLAEKYIALDSSGGNCCYSGCTGCEYRLPGGGYKMADQTSSRPKWIPHYDTRVSKDNSHTTKWVQQLFLNDNVTAITKDEFVNKVIQLEYVPPLGGPYISASSAQITDLTVLGQMYNILVNNNYDDQQSSSTEERLTKEFDATTSNTSATAAAAKKLTKLRMSIRIKQLSNGEEGMTWQSFERAFLTSID